MYHETPQKVADVLEREMGLTRGIAYAEKISRTARMNHSEMAVLYDDAACILANRLDAMVTSMTGMTADERSFL